MVARETVSERVTRVDIDEARDALAVAEAELVRVREEFFDDRGATWADVKEREGIVEFASAQIEKLVRAEARYQADVRLSAAGALHDEICAHAMGVGPRLADMARVYWDARLGFLAAVEEHNARVGEFRARAVQLDVPAASGRPVGFARDGGLQLPLDGVQAGRRELHRITGAYYLDRLDEFGDIDGVVSALSAIDAELPEPDDRVVHFRTQAGVVITFDEDHVPSREEILRGGLVEVSRSEAWGEDD